MSRPGTIEIPRVSSARIMGAILLQFSAPKEPTSDELLGLLSENECGRRGRKCEQIQALLTSGIGLGLAENS